ncbi:hypothetical protein LI095_07755 [Veillonella atypica]|uniref:hypothetical protein n=1 Tax=Veillonella atypica TaxID=39777 RepID=UPI001D0761E0|nr:hypothetical protein [Veillonella atypica]MCB6770634.1 hypothetical protein [Veillonella atypica]
MRKSRTTSMRLNLKLLLSGLLLVLLAFCSSVSFAASQVDISQPEPTISVPLSDWNKLKERLMIADASIESSTKSLEQANSLTVTQTTELKELRIINSERAKALTELREINEKQGQELAKASSKITEQEQSLTLASNSLDELKNEIKNNRRTEQRLRRQRDTWAAGGVIGFLIGAAGAIR